MKKIVAFILFNTLLYAVTKPLIFDKELKGKANNYTDYTYTFESKTSIYLSNIKYNCTGRYGDDYVMIDRDSSSRQLLAGKHKLTFSCSGSYVLKVDSPTELYTGGENFTSYIGPISTITRGKFLSQFTNFNTNDLESEITSDILHFGSAGNTKVTTYNSEWGFGTGGCDNTISSANMIRDTASNDDFWTTSGTKFFSANCYNNFKFTKPISAFGFYGIEAATIYMYIHHVDGTITRFRIPKNKDYYYNYIPGNPYSTSFVGVITRTLGKAIKLVSIKVRYKGFWDVGSEDTVSNDAKFDDFVVADSAYIRDGDMDGDGVINSRDPFPANPSESVDTDHDGIGNNADKDDDGDGISDILEKHYHLNPLDASDAGKDADGDGFSNVIEIELGLNPYSKNSHPKWAPIMMHDITIFIPYK